MIKRNKAKYHINPVSLTIEKVRVTSRDYMKKFVWYATVSVAFSTVVLLIAYNLFDSPKEKMLRREIEQFKFQFELLNDRVNKVNVVLEDIQKRDDNIYRAVFEAEPIPLSIRKAGFGGVDKYVKLEGFDNSDLIIETTKKIDMISRQLYVQSKSYDEVIDLVKNKTALLASTPAIVPLENGDDKIVSGFGIRIHPFYKTAHMHTGIDFLVKTGTPIYATGDGQVIDEKPGGYGIVCVIDHGFGFKTLYAHMSRMIVKPGQKVKRGQVIGYVGNTGISTGPHLHYEVIKNNKKVNPVNYFFHDLNPEQYEKVIELASKYNQSLS